jgi:MoaA/NifB/PqqE/SkfB family radical SAM enzyme
MVSITGGEPLMNPDVFDICNYIQRKGMVITYMPTNGIMVTKVVAKRLKDADVRLVGISIDLDDGHGMGLTRKIQDLDRVVVNAREILEEAGIKTYAGVLLTKATLDISKLLDKVTRLGFRRVIFSYPQVVQESSYKASREMRDLVLDLGEVEKTVADIKSAKKQSQIAIHNPKVSLDELVRFYGGVPRKFKCHGGRKLFYLDWNLDLYRCFTLPKCYGNLLKLGCVPDNLEGELCDLCYQQAFRDHDPFYHAATTIEQARKLAGKGHLATSAKLLANEKTYASLGAVSEFLTGGFS